MGALAIKLLGYYKLIQSPWLLLSRSVLRSIKQQP